MSDSVIILTTTVHIQYKIYLFQTDKMERVNTYLKRIRQWLNETDLKIVVVENTGYTFEELNEEKEKYKDRFEVITYNENQLAESAYLNGNIYKGASEVFSIHYAYRNSALCKNAEFVIKITGRFFIPKFESFIQYYKLQKFDVLTQSGTNRCEMVGCHKSKFDSIFNIHLTNANGDYDGHVEDVYKYRCSQFPNRIQCPEFDIEPTQRGGIDEIFYTI